MSKELSSLEALEYLEDIAYGRKMSYTPYELKQIIEKSLKALEIIKNNCDVDNIIAFCVNNEKERDLLKEVLKDE